MFKFADLADHFCCCIFDLHDETPASALSQQLSLPSSGIKACLSSVNVLADSVMFVSSADILGAAARGQFGRSLIYIRNSKGPSILPCGTPQQTLRDG